MKHLLLIFFLFSGHTCIAADSCLSGEKIPGSYLVDKGKGYQPSTLEIWEYTLDESSFPFELESYWSPQQSDDGASTSQAIYSGEIKVLGCTGTYYSIEDDCKFSFTLSANTITVSHTGNCMFIGHNADPSGIYFKQ